MKHFFKIVGLAMLVLGVLTFKIYLDLIERPPYYLNQIGAAIVTHNLVEFEELVDLNGVAQGIVNDYFAGLTKQPDPGTAAALKAELIPALVEQMREYVKTGQFKNLTLANNSKTSRQAMAQLIVSSDAVKQFQKIAFVKETGKTASAGVKSTAVTGGGLVVQFNLQRLKSGWRVVRIANYADIKKRMLRQEKQKNVKIEDLLVQGVKNSVIWGKFDRDEVVLELSSSNIPAWPTSLEINLDGQGRLCFTLVGFDTDSYNIPLTFDPGEAEAFEADGQLNKHYYVQAGEYDFDQDGRAELVIAIGDNNIDLVVDVFKYIPSLQGDTAKMKPENWVLAKAFMGQNKAYLNGGSIRLPYSAVNVEVEYQWGKNGFQEVH